MFDEIIAKAAKVKKRSDAAQISSTNIEKASKQKRSENMLNPIPRSIFRRKPRPHSFYLFMELCFKSGIFIISLFEHSTEIPQ